MSLVLGDLKQGTSNLHDSIEMTTLLQNQKTKGAASIRLPLDVLIDKAPDTYFQRERRQRYCRIKEASIRLPLGDLRNFLIFTATTSKLGQTRSVHPDEEFSQPFTWRQPMFMLIDSAKGIRYILI